MKEESGGGEAKGKKKSIVPFAVRYFDQLADSACVDVKTLAIVEGISVATTWRWVKSGVLPKPEAKLPGTNSTRWIVGKIRQARAARQEAL